MNITITSANAPKVVSIATAIYWATAGWLVAGDLISGNWMKKDGGWIGLVILTGFCGVGFWSMLAPATIRAFKAKLRPFRATTFAEAVWCFSTVPLVLICFSLVLLMVYYRVAEL